MAKEFLSRKGVPYVERDVAADPAAAMEMIRVSHQRGVPVIVIDGQVVVGFDRPALERLLSQRKPDLGLAVTSATAYAQKHGLQLPQGAYVGAVRPGGAGAAAGLAPGDVITAVDGRPVRSDADLEALVRGLQGRRVRVTYWRSGEVQSAELAL